MSILGDDGGGLEIKRDAESYKRWQLMRGLHVSSGILTFVCAKRWRKDREKLSIPSSIMSRRVSLV